MNEKVQAIVKKIEEQKAKMLKLFEKELKAILKSAGPLVSSLSFKAYTAYYCDGDECTYYVYLDNEYIDVNGISYEKWEEEFKGKLVSKRYSSDQDKLEAALYLKLSNLKDLPEEVTVFKNEVTPAKLEKYEKACLAIDAFCNFLSEFESDLIRLVFGDHVEVTVSKEGVKLSPYTEHN